MNSTIRPSENCVSGKGGMRWSLGCCAMCGVSPIVNDEGGNFFYTFALELARLHDYVPQADAVEDASNSLMNELTLHGSGLHKGQETLSL